MVMPMLFAAALAVSPPRSGRTLVTPHYTITIEDLCPEYDVGCDKVRYHAVSSTGKTLTLMGKQAMAMCRDGVTPCHPLGYRFLHRGVTYFVSEDGELTVTQGKKTLVDEPGTWKSE